MFTNLSLANKVAVGAGVAATILLVLFLRKQFFPVPIDLQAKHALDCELSDDGGCLVAFIPDEEQRAYQLTPDKLQNLLERFVDPVYKGAMKGAPQVRQVPLRSEGYFEYGLFWPRSDSEKPLMRGVKLAITKNGPMAPNLISTLIKTTLLEKYWQPNDATRYDSLERGLDRELPVLTGAGFDGVFNPDLGRLETWKELRDRWVKSEADLLARVSSDG